MATFFRSYVRTIAIVFVSLVVLLTLRSYVSQLPLLDAVHTLSDNSRHLGEVTELDVFANGSTPISIESTDNAKSVTQNATLGFGAILYISLDKRTDKQDAMTLLAESTGIKMQRIPGVDVTTMAPQAIPVHAKATGGSLGAWRAHANAWRKIIEEEWSAALILEDDADWDVALKEELELLSGAIQGSESILGSTNYSSEVDWNRDPYGVDWDVLFIGQCHHDNQDDPKGFRYEDPNTPDYASLDLNYHYEMVAFNTSFDGYRTVSKAFAPICTTAYAVSHKGAYRLLYNIGYSKLDGPTDNEIADHLQAGTIRGLVVTPPLMSQFRTGGNRDSDINGSEVQDEGRSNEEGSGSNIKNSARKALKTWVELD